MKLKHIGIALVSTYLSVVGIRAAVNAVTYKPPVVYYPPDAQPTPIATPPVVQPAQAVPAAKVAIKPTPVIHWPGQVNLPAQAFTSPQSHLVLPKPPVATQPSQPPLPAGGGFSFY
jgi:hypothetical protein